MPVVEGLLDVNPLHLDVWTEAANDDLALNTTGSITGTFTPDATNTAAGRGTAVIEGQSYAYYIVDSTRVRFISTNSTGSGPMLSGDAVSRSGVPPAPSGGFAFIVAGASANGGIIRLCRFSVSGATVNNILMDVNNAGSENEFGSSSLSNASLTYDSTTGRGTLSFQSSAVNVYEFVFYLDSPSSGVIQEVSPNDTTPAFDVADGSLALQSGSPFTSSNITGPYAMNWSGLVNASGLGTDEEDLLSQVTVSSLKLSGTSDYFQFTGVTLNTNVGTAGSINLNGGNGTGDDGKPVNMAINLSGASQINMVVYIVNPQLAFFVSGNNSPTRVVAGILRAQQ